MLVLVCFMVACAQASAAATGVCQATPEAGTKKCKETQYYPKTEVFTSEQLEAIKVTDSINTIECKKAKFISVLGKNPSTGAVALEVKSVEFGECKIVGGVECTMTSPAPRETPMPWEGLWEWTTFGTTGPNGSVAIKAVSIRGKCGTEEVNYIGGGANQSLVGSFYNADDTNKPAASTRAEIQFNKASMTARRIKGETEEEITGAVTFSGVYDVLPANTSKNVYLGNG